MNKDSVKKCFFYMYGYFPEAACVVETGITKEENCYRILCCNEVFGRRLCCDAGVIEGSCLFEVIPYIDSELFKRAAEQCAVRHCGAFDQTKSQKIHVDIFESGQEGFLICIIKGTASDEEYAAEPKGTLEEALRSKKNVEKYMSILATDYTALYYINAKTDTFSFLKVQPGSNAFAIKEQNCKKKLSFREFCAQYIEKFVVPEDQKSLGAWLDSGHLSRALSEKAKTICHYRSVKNGEGQQYFEAQAYRLDQDNGEQGILLGFRYIDDVIEKENTRRRIMQLAFDEARLSNEIVSAIGSIYFSIFSIDLRVDSYEEITSDHSIHKFSGKKGVASEKLEGLCSEHVADEYYAEVKRFFDLSTLSDRLKKEKTVAMEYLAKDKNWHLARFITKKRNSDGDVTKVLFMISIISERKHKEQNLVYAAELANRENKMKTDFLSKIAHEIRTPMNAVRGFTAIAKANIDDREKIERGLAQIEIAGKYLQQIVDDVLNITSLENGTIESKAGPVSISGVFNEFSALIDYVKPDKELTYECNLHDIEHDVIIADISLLKQIFMNLLSNSITYTKDGGAITFEVYQEKVTEGRVRVIVWIRDTGVGMTKEYMNEMYDRFSRAVDTRINQVRGSGLGLSIVKELVEHLGGSVEAYSELGKGTSFKVSLEFEYVESAAEAECRQDIAYKGLRILIAEDNDLNYEVAQELLSMYGIECDRARDGLECISVYENADTVYDMILMDIQMPVMNGIAATQKIREHEAGMDRSVPIIAITANMLDEDLEMCKEAGIDDYLSKPFEIERMLEVIGRYCVRE